MAMIREVPHPRAVPPEQLRVMARRLEAATGRPVDPADLVEPVTERLIPHPLAPDFIAWIRPDRPPRRWLPKAERRAIVRTFRRTSTFCLGLGTVGRGPDGMPWDYDHYVPKARGGSCKAANLVLACETCNYRKDCELWLPGTTSEALRPLPCSTSSLSSTGRADGRLTTVRATGSPPPSCPLRS